MRLYRTGALLGAAGRDYQIEIKLKLTGLSLGFGKFRDGLVLTCVEEWVTLGPCYTLQNNVLCWILASVAIIQQTYCNHLQSMQSMYTFCAPQSSSGFWQWQKMPHDGKQSRGCSQSVNYLFITKDTQSLIVGLFHCVRHTTQCLLMILTRITKAAYILVKWRQFLHWSTQNPYKPI